MEYDLEYNSAREHLIIPEYGRHIQKMVNHCIALPTKEERNKMANAIIEVMGNLQPHLRDVPDFKHKLWDQLFIISDFKLDADCPYPTPSKEELTAKPDKLDYPKASSKYKFYGKNIQIMIDTAMTWEEGELKEALVYTIANHMKKCYLNWNKDTVEDTVIFRHLAELSGDKLILSIEDETLSESKNLLRKKVPHKNKNQKNNNHSNHKNRKKR